MRILKPAFIMLLFGINLNLFAAIATKTSTNASINVASAYLIRGDTINKGPALQPSLSISNSSGLTFGFWGNFNIEDENENSNEGEFGEIDVYVDYELPLGSDLVSASVGFIEYTYPGAFNEELDTQSDRAIKLSASLAPIANPSVTLYYALAGAIEEDLYGEISISEDIYKSKDLTIGIAAIGGYIDPKIGEQGWRHGTLALTGGFGNVSASVNYVFETDEEVLDLDEDEDEQLWVTVGTGYTF